MPGDAISIILGGTVDLIQQIEQAIEPTLQGQGYGIVRIKLDGLKRRTLQIMIERLDEQGITIDDCTTVHRAVSVLLDLEDFIKTAYNLEISSPGLDRPLIKKRDYERFKGHDVNIRTYHPIAGQRRFSGRLEDIGPDDVQLLITLNDTDNHVVSIPFVEISQAQLQPKF